MPNPETSITVEQTIAESVSLHNSCRAVWVCKRCGNCARHCKHDDAANFHEDLTLPCSGPCQCIDCVPIDEPVNVELFRIKPLEWEENPMGEYFYTQPLGERSIMYWIYRDCWFSTLTPTRTVASSEEGKQLAEQHWREYIKQALVPVETEQ